MSKHERPLIDKYWQEIGGTLCREYRVVDRGDGCSPRWVDAIIVPEGPTIDLDRQHPDIKGKHVIVVQAKRGRLGMYLMGQAVFSAELVRRLGVASVVSVALCEETDSVLEPLLAAFPDVQVKTITVLNQ